MQVDRVQKLEKAAALKAQLPFMDAQTKLKEQMERLKVEKEIAGISRS